MHDNLFRRVATVAGFLASMALAPLSAAHATIIDHGSYLSDTTSGLDWLDLTATAGLSFNTVSASPPPGGWHYASLSDVATLFDDAGGVGPYNFVNSNNGLVAFEGSATSLLRSLMGDTSPLGLPGAAGITSDVDLSVGCCGPYPQFLAWYLDFPPTTNYLLVPFGSFGPDASDPEVGSFLVRDTSVPEPISLSLFGAGLAGLAAFRRRKSQRN